MHVGGLLWGSEVACAKAMMEARDVTRGHGGWELVHGILGLVGCRMG